MTSIFRNQVLVFVETLQSEPCHAITVLRDWDWEFDTSHCTYPKSSWGLFVFDPFFKKVKKGSNEMPNISHLCHLVDIGLTFQPEKVSSLIHTDALVQGPL